MIAEVCRFPTTVGYPQNSLSVLLPRKSRIKVASLGTAFTASRKLTTALQVLWGSNSRKRRWMVSPQLSGIRAYLPEAHFHERIGGINSWAPNKRACPRKTAHTGKQRIVGSTEPHLWTAPGTLLIIDICREHLAHGNVYRKIAWIGCQFNCRAMILPKRHACQLRISEEDRHNCRFCIHCRGSMSGPGKERHVLLGHWNWNANNVLYHTASKPMVKSGMSRNSQPWNQFFCQRSQSLQQRCGPFVQ